MDEETPHFRIDFVPFIYNSKRGLDTRASLKGALGEQGFQGGTRGATEWNQWIETEKQGRQKEVSQLEKDISGSREKVSHIFSSRLKQSRKRKNFLRQTPRCGSRKKLLSGNQKLEKEQKRLQQELRRWLIPKRSWNGTYMRMMKIKNGSYRIREP